MQKDELKPCPFCGGEPIVDDSCADITVICTECGVQPRCCKIYEDQSRKLAFKAWNTRAIEDTLRARMAELEGVIPFTKEEMTHIKFSTIGAMRIQHERDGRWAPWWIKFVEWALRGLK